MRPRQKKSKKRDDDEEMDDDSWKPGDDSHAKNAKIAPRKASVSACLAQIHSRTSANDRNNVVEGVESPKVVEGVESPPTCELKKRLDKRILKPTKVREYAGKLREVVYDQKIDLWG